MNKEESESIRRAWILQLPLVMATLLACGCHMDTAIAEAADIIESLEEAFLDE